MAYIAQVHRPTSVRTAVALNLLSSDEESLALSKGNRLEIWRVTDEGMAQMYAQPLNGTISMLQKLRPKDHPTDLLFVGTDRQQYFTAQWFPETEELKVVQGYFDESERFMRDALSQDRCLVDSTGKFLVMHLWEGVMSTFRLMVRGSRIRMLQFMSQIRLSELFMRASTFLYSETGHPTIAFLYNTRNDFKDLRLATYRLTKDDKDMEAAEFNVKDRIIDMPIADSGASILIPVRKVGEEVKRHNFRNTEAAKPHMGGLIVVGETQMLYIDTQTKAKVKSNLKTASIFVAWAKIHEQAYFLADDYGAMHLLTIHTEGPEVTGMTLTLIGRTSRARSLIYFSDNKLLFVASSHGDSQLFRVYLEDENRPSGKYLQLVQRLHNNGPILDFEVMDLGNREADSYGQVGSEYSSGQARIVTASGIHKDGSLRSMRSGVGLQDLGILAELENVRGLFSLSSRGAGKVDTLVASFLTETRVIRFNAAGEAEELESFMEMDLEQRTILVANTPSGQVLHVTTTSATLLDSEGGMVLESWRPEDGQDIINASTNGKWLLLSIEGTLLVSLLVERHLQFAKEKKIDKADQVACLHVAPHLEDVGVVGFWASGTVSIIEMASLEPIHGTALRRSENDASIPRNIALIQTLPRAQSGPTLFIALEDGSVVTFTISATDYSFSGKKSVSLGSREAQFYLLPQHDGLCNILSTSEHPSLIYGEDGRMTYSAVSAEGVLYACPFDADAFPGCIAVATASQIRISRIDSHKQTHVKPLPMKKMVRRIAYSPHEKVFGLGCIKRELVRGEELIASSFELVDEVIFDHVGRPFALEHVRYLELVEAVIRARLPDGYGNQVERFIVGTSAASSYEEEDADREKPPGRILVFGIDSDRNPYLIAKHELKSGCRSLAVLAGDKIVAALTKTVVVCQYEETSTTSGTLTLLAKHRPATYPVDVFAHGNMIGIGDLMKSMSVVEYMPPEAGPRGRPARLVQRGTHFASMWTTAVAHVEEESWLEADADGNLIVVRRNLEGLTDADKMRMEVTSEMRLGEQVNRIRRISVETRPGALVVPRAFLGTVEGSVYVFGTIAPHAQDLLLRFQTNLLTVVNRFGEILEDGEKDRNVSFIRWRSFKNAEREGDAPFRFVDGDLLEEFLRLDERKQREVCKGLGPTVEDMRGMVEELARLH